MRAAGTPPGQANKLTTLLMTSATSTLPIRKESFPSCWGMLEKAGGLTGMLKARPLSDLANPSRTLPVLRLCAKLTPTNTALGYTQKACWAFICATGYCVYVKIQEHRPARRTSPASSRKLSTAGGQSSPRLQLSFWRIKGSLARSESSERCSSPPLTGTPPLEPAPFRGTTMASGQCLTIGTNSGWTPLPARRWGLRTLLPSPSNASFCMLLRLILADPGTLCPRRLPFRPRPSLGAFGGQRKRVLPRTRWAPCPPVSPKPKQTFASFTTTFSILAMTAITAP